MTVQPLLIKTSDRKALRTNLQLPIVVVSKSHDKTVSREITRTLNVSPLGLSFVIKRTFEAGQLIHLSLPLPAEMRKYDHAAADYEIWGIVRYCHRIAINSNVANQIGVAFIGNQAPRSYDANPFNLYDLTVCPDNGFWHFFETGRTINRRKSPRFKIPIEVVLTALDASGNPSETEHTVTETISVGGASVYSSMHLTAGAIVKVFSPQYNVSLSAEVKHLRTASDGIQRIHLMFTDGNFPLEGIEQI